LPFDEDAHMKTSFPRPHALSACAATVSLALLFAVGNAPAQAVREAAAADAVAASPPASQDARLHRGAYLARAGDCAACHTAAGGKPFAGGLPMSTPFGTIYSTNITPDKASGIGTYSFEDFERALREGKSKRNGHLYPAMPYPSFRILSQDDMQALYAYFMHGVAPVNQANHANALPFPFNMRALMIGWNLLYLKHDGPYWNDATRSVEWNRGAYLVQGLEHCGACHTPHGITGEEEALNEYDAAGDRYLAGATLAGWNAPTLTGALDTGLAGWSKEDIVLFLKSGRTAHTAAFGAMTEVVGDSTQYLSDADLKAIAEYLKALPGNSASRGAAAATQTDAEAQTTQGTVAAARGTEEATALARRNGDLQVRGAHVYLDNCNACHRSDGAGAPHTFPSLAGNPVVTSDDPTSLIHIVLSGSRMPSTSTSPTPLAMPDFGWRLDDQQIADVLTFIRSSWGNQAAAVEAASIAQLRRTTTAGPSQLRTQQAD
jgi:mono/diheme cytochrome c family protein